MASIADQKILFLQGSQTDLDALAASSIQVGAFYLTNDSHRLYIGDSEVINGETVKKITPVNQGLIKVATEADLPEVTNEAEVAGHFYLIEAGNILCIRSQGKWVQINTDTTLKSFKHLVERDANAKTVTVNTNVTDTSDKSVNDAFVLKEGDGIGFTVTNLGDSANPKYQITISATGGDGFTLEQTVNQATIDGTEDVNDKKVDIKTKTIPHLPNGDEDPEHATEEFISIEAGENIESVKASVDLKSVVINAATQDVTGIGFSNNEDTDIFNGNGYTLTLTQKTGETQTANIDPIIEYGSTPLEGHFKDGKAQLNVYTIGEVDAILTEYKQTADAMTYRGVIMSVGELPVKADGTAEVRRGDTYKIGVDFEIPGDREDITGATVLTKGDLLIAIGEENENGLLVAGATYEIIPSGDEEDIAAEALTHGLKVGYGVGDNFDTKGSFALTAGQNIELTDIVDKSEVTVEIKHSTIETTPTTTENTVYTEGEKTVQIVKSIITENGHVTGITSGTETFKDTQLDSVTSGLSDAATKGVVATFEVKDTSGNTSQASVTFDSDTLTLAKDGSTIKTDLIWGSFGTV